MTCRHHHPTAAGLLLLVATAGCRGDLSPNPPIHLNDNMDNQRYIQPQEPSTLFKDGRGMRPQVPGTIARGELRDNHRFYDGKHGGKWIHRLAVKLSRPTLARGRQRFDVYCAVCHGYTGEGTNSVMMKKSIAVPPPSYLDPRLRAMPVGQLYDVVKNGVRNMPAYLDRIPAGDRWAIVAYVRALQVAGSATLERIPRAIAEQRGWTRR